MIIEDARGHYYKHSKSLSDVNRQLAFAGIAVIWIFTKTEKLPLVIPDDLLFPLLFFLISLSLDLCHYISQAWSWGIFQYYKEQIKKVKSDEQFKAPNWINTTGVLFWVAKVIANVIGYYLLLFNLWGY